MVEALKPGGLVLDLQAIRPQPVVESDGETICELDGEWLLARADAAAAAVDAAIADGRLVEEAADDHDVRKHYPTGSDLIDDFTDSQRNVPVDAFPRLRALDRTCAVRERCRLRRLRVA